MIAKSGMFPAQVRGRVGPLDSDGDAGRPFCWCLAHIPDSQAMQRCGTRHIS